MPKTSWNERHWKKQLMASNDARGMLANDDEMNKVVEAMALGVNRPISVRSQAVGNLGSSLSERMRQDRRLSEDVRWGDLLRGDEVMESNNLRHTVVSVTSREVIMNTGLEVRHPNLPLKDVGFTLAKPVPDGIESAEAPTTKKGVDFNSVIMPQAKKDMIIDAIRQVDNHDLIFNQWGFGEVLEKGTAISMLFYGQPGTGKTLMAQAIADKYNYELTVVSTAEIETPEPGGAERNIQKYFKEAGDRTVLLFDECDSLISDRKHLGMIMAAQVNALLTGLEQHKGIVIFTTNRLGALDPAFDRRLSLKLEFEMPDPKHRMLIWKRMFPKKAPLDKDIDWETLSQVEIAGGHIKNIVLRAARRAANTTKKITQDIIFEALLEEVKSNEAFKDALANHSPFYGTPTVGRGVSVDRKRGKVQVDRG